MIEVDGEGGPTGWDAWQIESVQALGDRAWWVTWLILTWMASVVTVQWTAPLIPFIVWISVDILLRQVKVRVVK